MNFREKVRYICDQEGINVKKFSELSGIPYGTLNSYYQGKTEPRISQIEQISEVAAFKKYRKILMDNAGASLSTKQARLIDAYNELEKAGDGELLLDFVDMLLERKKRRDKKG